MDISITTNAIAARHFFDSLERDQLPYGISRAINRIAFDLRDEEQGDLDKYFDIRTNWLTKRGAMPVVSSRKKQYPNIFAVLGVKDEVAALSILGGTRSGEGGDMAVPFSNSGSNISARAILNPGKETLPQGKWPSNIVKENSSPRRRRKGGKPKPFYLTAKSGRKFVALRSSASRFPLQFLYEFKDSAFVPASWPLVENSSDFISHHYASYLSEELDKAVRSMKV